MVVTDEELLWPHSLFVMHSQPSYLDMSVEAFILAMRVKNCTPPLVLFVAHFTFIFLMVTSPLIICLSLKKMIICSSHWFDNPVNLSSVHLLGQGNTGSNPCYLQLLCFHSYASALVSFWMLLPSSIIHWQRSHLALWLVMKIFLPHKCPIFPASERSSLPKKSISNIIPKFSGTWYNMTNCAY